MLVAACGGGGGAGSATGAGEAAIAPTPVVTAPAPVAPQPAPITPPAPAPGVAAVTIRDAQRLADQATFGATESSIAEIQRAGPGSWIATQMSSNVSRYTLGKGSAIHTNTSATFFCDLPANAGVDCWRDWFSNTPLTWDFYRNATTKPDQLRQRVAFALAQIVVVSAVDIEGTYGLRNYHNALLDNAFGNYRQVLKKVAMSPVMGDFLNGVNNDKAAPNENFPRELLQLFSIGTCDLDPDGSLKGGACHSTYTNDVVRSYAYALTGWTYPAGGVTAWSCLPQGANCRYYGGDMVPVAKYHDTAARPLLSGVTVPAGSTADGALEAVLDSLMTHPNMAPFIGRQLIQHLVSSNPSSAYVGRVAAAFTSGTYAGFGNGTRGDLAATIAAVLLDAEARGETVAATAGRLRDPVQMFTGVLRSLNGQSDGDALGWWWGDMLREHVFRAPSVFNFYSPSFPVAGTSLVGPAFGLHNADAALQRLNFLTYLMDWGGSAADPGVPGATGTSVDLSAWLIDAADAAKLVDRMSAVAIGKPLSTTSRSAVIAAVSWWTASTDATNWKTARVKAAAYLVFASPDYQVQR